MDPETFTDSFVPAGSSLNGRIKSIIVINNSQDLPGLMEGVLGEEGYEINILYASEDAHRRIVDRHPSLVILDMVLEKPNGTWQLLQILKLDPSTKGIPVIVCSSDSAYHEAHIAQLGFSGCRILPKPFDPDNLRNMIQEALGEIGV